MPINCTIADAKKKATALNIALEAMHACVKASKAMSDWDSRTRTIYKRWFGAPASDTDRGVVPTVISKMAYVIAECSFTVEYDATMGATTNAMATHYTTIQSLDTLGGMGGTPVKMKLGDTFFNNLTRNGSNDQTQLETFIHELSHIAGATIDHDRADSIANLFPGKGWAVISCYGRANALNMALNHPVDRSRTNAENYGFFIIDIAGLQPVTSAKNSAGKWTVKIPPRVGI